MSYTDDEMDFDQFEVKPKNYKTRFLVIGLMILASVVGILAIYVNTTGVSNIEKYDFNSEQSFQNSFTEISDIVDFTQDEHVVGFYDLEEKIEFIKIEDDVYLIPKKNTLVEVYENDNKQLVIKVK